MKPLYLFALISLLLLTTCFAEVSEECKTRMRGDMEYLYGHYKRIAESNPSLRAGFIKAAFKDCMPVTASKPTSGCNGSLRFELGDPDNFYVRPGANRVNAFKERTCVSYADAYLLAFVAASREPSGSERNWTEYVNPDSPREDSDTPDYGPDGKLDLPRDGKGGYASMLEYYRVRGMTEQHLVASMAVGHSVGQFHQDGTAIQFNPYADDSQTLPLYGINLLFGYKFNAPDLCSFNSMPADRALVNDPNARDLLSKNAIGFELDKTTNLVERVAKVIKNKRVSSAPWPQRGRINTRVNFDDFVKKMSQLSGNSLIA